jgi:hypothetical protein
MLVSEEIQRFAVKPAVAASSPGNSDAGLVGAAAAEQLLPTRQADQPQVDTALLLAAVPRTKKGGKSRRCLMAGCPFCFRPNCGECASCLNPHHRNRCIKRNKLLENISSFYLIYRFFVVKVLSHYIRFSQM